MIGSLLGFLAVLFLLFYQGINENLINWNAITPFLITFPFLFLLIEAFSFLFLLNPLEKASKNSSPHIFSLIKKNKTLLLFSFFLFSFAIFSLLLAAFAPFESRYPLAIWLFFFGVSFDCLKFLLTQERSYLDPFSAIWQFKAEGIKEIQNQKEIELCSSIDALAETSTKAIKNESPSLANTAIDAIQELSHVFLESSKSISHQNQDKEMQSLGIQDKVTYILAYLFQKLNFISDKALQEKLEPVVSFLITATGKIALHAAKCDMTLSISPLLHFGKFSVKAVEQNFLDAGVRATCTLLEIAKVIVNEIDLKYLEIQEPFFCLIGQLETISKELFKQDKSIKIALLAQPFIDLKTLFQSEALATHQDTPVIQKDLDRILAELQMLETVMRTMPPIGASLTDLK
ncbi:MAG TPA: hypothetical protein PLC42_03570 [Parachlamydiaceae bacterium]|nr:hypothetical protein [Parachlamydiaceae bacterium]